MAIRHLRRDEHEAIAVAESLPMTSKQHAVYVPRRGQAGRRAEHRSSLRCNTCIAWLAGCKARAGMTHSPPVERSLLTHAQRMYQTVLARVADIFEKLSLSDEAMHASPSRHLDAVSDDPLTTETATGPRQHLLGASTTRPTKCASLHQRFKYRNQQCLPLLRDEDMRPLPSLSIVPD